MNLNEAKAGFTALGAFISSILGILYVPVILMVLCNCIDFATGIMASIQRGESLKSIKTFNGILKKVCMWLLVIVGVIVDELIKYAASVSKVEFPFTFMVGCVVTVWIICSELISILENMISIGVALPPFLMPIIKLIQKQTEEKAKVGDNHEGHNEMPSQTADESEGAD